MDPLIICKKFIKEKLNFESWFQQMINACDCDLLLLTGSAVKNNIDIFSDIDIFLVCKYKTQKKYSLRPIYVYNYHSLIIELSVVSTEKLFNDQNNKNNIYWWHKSRIIKSYNKKARTALLKASFLDKKDALDRLWTNFVRFEINSLDIDKLIKRKELLSIRLLFQENIKLLIDSILVQFGEYPQYKWFGKILEQENQKLYKKILQAQNNTDDIKKVKKYNSEFKVELVKILKINNFSGKEINNWENCNLDKITFQYR